MNADFIDEAKEANMPKDTIEKAIAKGTGELGGENYEAVVYEGYGPGGVAFIVEGLTNNRARTAPEMRKIFEVAGGNLATSGAVAYQFKKQGIIAIKSDAIIVPIGFLSDHVETLYDIDIEFRARADKLGLRLERMEMPNAADDLAETLAALVDEHLSPGPRGAPGLT